MDAIKRITVASFDVDAQKTFTPLCPDELPVPGGDDIVDQLNENAKLATLRVGSRDAHPSNASWITDNPEEILQPIDGETNVDVKWPRHAMLGTRGFELLDGLPHPIEGYHFMVNKGLDPDCHPYGACYHDLSDTVSTGVIEFLRSNGIETVIVGGLALDFCVAKTVEQLINAGFSVILNKASTRGIDDNACNEAIESMIAAGVTVVESSDDIARSIP